MQRHYTPTSTPPSPTHGHVRQQTMASYAIHRKTFQTTHGDDTSEGVATHQQRLIVGVLLPPPLIKY